MLTPTRLECRRRMHYAEHLARIGADCPRHLRPAIEAAYLSHECETLVAQRIHVALDLIDENACKKTRRVDGGIEGTALTSSSRRVSIFIPTRD